MIEKRVYLDTKMTFWKLWITVLDVYPTEKWDDTPLNGALFCENEKLLFIIPGAELAKTFKKC
jgi:hypothetical protein